MNDIRKDLAEARKLYNFKRYEESLEIYERLFKENPEAFTASNKVSYAWAIYHVHIKNATNEYEMFDYTEFITEITNQGNLNKFPTCPYTFSVFKVMDKLKDQNDYFNLVYWIEKINPDILSQARAKPNGRSRKEKYFDYASKTYLELEDYEMCIEVSRKALDCLFKFTNNGDTWHRWRIGKSLGKLGHHEEALEYLSEVIKVKQEWYIYREIADNYNALGNQDEAMKYICDAVLTEAPVTMKVNLFGLIYQILKDKEPEIAIRHAELYYLLKLESGSGNILQEIEELNIDEDTLDMFELTSKIKEYWKKFKFRNQELQFGTVTRFFEDKNYGFIKTNDDKSLFFHRNEFKDDTINVGQLVSFYTEKRFDKTKNQESLNAVNIKAE